VALELSEELVCRHDRVDVFLCVEHFFTLHVECCTDAKNAAVVGDDYFKSQGFGIAFKPLFKPLLELFGELLDLLALCFAVDFFEVFDL